MPLILPSLSADPGRPHRYARQGYCFPDVAEAVKKPHFIPQTFGPGVVATFSDATGSAGKAISIFIVLVQQGIQAALSQTN